MSLREHFFRSIACYCIIMRLRFEKSVVIKVTNREFWSVCVRVSQHPPEGFCRISTLLSSNIFGTWIFSYWYEQKDAGKFSSADIFDPVYGFGGDGSSKEGCITDGPFANYTNSLGPGYEITDHCIDRKFNDEVSLYTSRERVENCTSQLDWISAWHCIEREPHAGGHNGVGGQVSDDQEPFPALVSLHQFR